MDEQKAIGGISVPVPQAGPKKLTDLMDDRRSHQERENFPFYESITR
jgi:hypothetical protein